jgi:GcrA cell cycle regulator
MMAWNDERVAILKKMWLDGNSASEIAKELGNITRNAVIGKVHRLGLSNRDTNISKSGATPTKAIKNAKRGRPPKVNQEPKKRGRPQKPKGPTDFREKINDADQSIGSSTNSKLSHESNLEVVSDLSEETIKNLLKVEMKSKKISLMELTERTCKWPIGDPATDTFWFCGHESEPGKPYCKTHISIAFQPISHRRSRRESQ